MSELDADTSGGPDPLADPEAPASSYAEATAEIDAILTELERDDLDVDLLAAKVRRAAELLVWCRRRIRLASDDVDAAVAALEDAGDPDAGSGDADEPF